MRRGEGIVRRTGHALVSGNPNEANEPVGCCVFRCSSGRFVPPGERSDDETTRAYGTTGQSISTRIRNRRPMDQFNCRSLDGIATQIMARVRSTLLWLGGSSSMAAKNCSTAVRRPQRTSSSFTIGVPSRLIRGFHAFCWRVDESFSGTHAGRRLERLGQY